MKRQTTTDENVAGGPLVQTLCIPGQMPNLNDVIETAAKTFRGRDGKPLRGVAWRELKSQWARAVQLHARAQGLQPIRVPAHFEFEFVEPNRRRDPDNLLGAIKILLDALVDAGFLPNDSWDEVASILPTWRLDRSAPMVRVTIRSER